MKKDKPHHLLFNKISSVYGLFFESQRKSFRAAIENARNELDITAFKSVLDVGSGTGALCSVLSQMGLETSGIEPAEKMRQVALKKTSGLPIIFKNDNILVRLTFDDQSFDLVMASYVAHGLSPENRERMYLEMYRVSRDYVILHDFNQSRSQLVTLVEWMEGSDYLRFIKNAEMELRDLQINGKRCFDDVTVVKVSKHASWYICKVSPNQTQSE